MFYGYLPEQHRIPALKRGSADAQSESSKPITALDNFKLQLITFGVHGSIFNSNPLAELTKQIDKGDASDDEEEVGVKRARMGDGNNTYILKKGISPYNISDKGRSFQPYYASSLKYKLVAIFL